MVFDIKAPCVAAQPFACYQTGDKIDKTSYSKLRRWAKRGWIVNESQVEPKQAQESSDEAEPEEKAVEEEEEAEGAGVIEPIVESIGGGWYSVTIGQEVRRYQGRAQLEEAGFIAPDA